MTAPTTHEAPWQFASAWGAKGYISDLGGPVHWIDFGGPADATPMVFVHGLGGSHLNWALIGKALAEGRRAVAIDLHGFGLTPGRRTTSTVQANAKLLDRFLREVIGTPVILVGNSMGGLISIMQAAAHPETVTGLVLVDPALPMPKRLPDPGVAATFVVYAVPGLGEVSMRAMQRRLSPEELVHRIINLCFADPGRANPQMIEIGANLVRERQQIARKEESFLGAARSLMKLLMGRAKIESLMDSVDVPVLLIHGEDDRLVPIASAQRVADARPWWETSFLPGIGHTPQLEDPEQTIGILRNWLASVPALATS
ncbi:MAG: alpha/beta hydrolase [Aeromicrobium sp.]